MNTIIYVYWIHDGSCVDPQTDGYVGITRNLRARWTAHRNSQRFPTDARYVVLFTGSLDECADIERHFRPDWQIGWNISPGGWLGGGPKPGSKRSQESIEKQRRTMTGRKRPREVVEKIAASNRGQKRSAETREKMRRCALARPVNMVGIMKVAEKNRGKSFYNDGERERLFFPKEVPEGWKPGRITWKKIRIFKCSNCDSEVAVADNKKGRARRYCTIRCGAIHRRDSSSSSLLRK